MHTMRLSIQCDERVEGDLLMISRRVTLAVLAHKYNSSFHHVFTLSPSTDCCWRESSVNVCCKRSRLLGER